ncbi:MAG TPA: four helix bundle protein [Thermoanaerobaculia bacterium]|nr:four helix bundle protein [Thermoanaerobaculia bacterium]
MSSYRDLSVWQDGMTLAVKIYAATKMFPAEERFGIVQQMRRAAVSIPSNIAEGYGRQTPRQRYNFLENALGSVFELETQTELSSRLEFLSADQFQPLADTIRGIGKGLTALMRFVETEARKEKKRFATPRNPEEPRNPRNQR